MFQAPILQTARWQMGRQKRPEQGAQTAAAQQPKRIGTPWKVPDQTLNPKPFSKGASGLHHL